MSDADSLPQPISAVFIGSNSRVAQLVGTAWPQSTSGGGKLLKLARRAGPGVTLTWDMAAPPPPLPEGPRPGALICFAGATPRGGGDLGANRDLAHAALGAARAWGVHGFFLSSAAVYGDPGAAPADEQSPPRRTGDYGAAKLEMEQALLDSGHPGLTILRLGNVAGAGEPFDAAATPRDSVPLERFGDGTGPVRSFVGPRTLAHVLARLSALATQGVPLPRLLNVAAPRPTAMADILDALDRRWHWVDPRPDAIATVHLDTTRLAALCPLPRDCGSARSLVDELKRDAARP